MGRRTLVYGALVGFLLTAPMIALMYLGDQLADLPFVPFDLFAWLTQVLPGPLITFGIDLMIDALRLVGLSVADTAKTAEQIMAVALFAFSGVLPGVVFFGFYDRRTELPGVTPGLVIGALFGLPLMAISLGFGQAGAGALWSFIWLAVLFLVWGFGLAAAYRRLQPSEPRRLEARVEDREVVRLNRRQFLIALGAASASITVVGSGVGAFLARNERRQREDALEDTMAHTSEGSPESPFPNAGDPLMPAPGTRPEYTPIKDHYKVFLGLEATVIEAAGYLLPITGLVDNPLMLSLDDIRNNFESRDQYVTLSCISGRVGTTLISTTLWTGVSLQRILEAVQVQPEARYLYITSGDGFHETMDLDLIASDERIMLCYAWDGNTLPVDHGFPLRVWIPDRFGMKQPKWITGFELIDEYREGYWVERGWDEVAQVKATSVIDTVAVDSIIESDGGQLIPIGGIAFSGDRGISKVEVRMDGGPWQEAELREPLSETTWVIWRIDWPFEPGEHLFEVRCAEADGTPQIEETRKARPSGSTGIHNLIARA